MAIRRVDELDLAERRVFCRVDLNIPLRDDGSVSDNGRIRSALKTLRYILSAGGKVICASHLGRPQGQRNNTLSMEPVGVELLRLLNEDTQNPTTSLILADDVVGDGVRSLVANLRAGEILLLENLRFDPGETSNDPDFCRELAALADVYVNDAFGAAHRMHASTFGIAPLIEQRGAGFLMMEEISALQKLFGDIDRPFLAILGGAKVSDKIGAVRRLVGHVDGILIGGAMANTFLAAQGYELGTSLVERDALYLARRALAEAERHGVKIHLPLDLLVADGPTSSTSRIVPISDFPADQAALDIGPATRALYCSLIASAKTAFWNGPMGYFENPAFSSGTFEIARACADSPAWCIVGGGDSVAALHQDPNRSDLEEKIAHVSTGGGASLKFIESPDLPGLIVLNN